MRTISNSLLIVAAALLPSTAAAEIPSVEKCAVQLGELGPKLEQRGYEIASVEESPGRRLLRARHVELAGYIDIEYRCGPSGLDVTVVNHGLPNIPFHVLLAAGPSAKHRQDMPDWLRKRYEAVRR